MMALTYGYTPQQIDDLPFLDFLSLAIASDEYIKVKAKSGF